jgi:CubicO group peptidase (beta-lactamase class C family)
MRRLHFFFLMVIVFTTPAINAQQRTGERAEQKLEAQPAMEQDANPLAAKFDSLLTAYANNGQFNGTVLIAKKGQVLFEKAYGYRDAGKKIMHENSDIFQIGSVTKQFTAAVIMQLVNEHKLSLNDKLEKFYPGFSNGNKITIHHLLTHTSGLYDYTQDSTIMGTDITRPRTRKEMIGVFRKYKPDFAPGTKWSYSNTGYSMLGYIIEKVTGKSYEKVVREKILQPLGMTYSGFDFTHLNDPRKSVGYFSVSKEINTPAPIVDSTLSFSAGALYSTVEDMYKWERAIYTEKILPQSSWKKVFTPYMNKYGYGWGIDSAYGKLVTAHSGGIHGFTSYIIRFPQEELTVIMLDNSMRELGKIALNLSAISMNKPYVAPKFTKEITLDKSVLEQYTGEYELAPGFILAIRLDGNQLKAQATGQQEIMIYPESENVFFLKVVEAKIEFVKDTSGKVDSIILHQGGRDLPGKKIK